MQIQKPEQTKTSHEIQVLITANEGGEEMSNPLYVIDLKLSQTSWKVRCTERSEKENSPTK